MPHKAKTIDGATVLLIDNKQHRHNNQKNKRTANMSICNSSGGHWSNRLQIFIQL